MSRWSGCACVLAGLMLAACAGTGRDTTATRDDVPGEVVTAGSTDSPAVTTAPTVTEGADVYAILLADVGMYPCQLLPEYAVQVTPAPDGPPLEESSVDGEGSITGVCDYGGIVTLRVFIPGPEVDVQASYDQAVPDEHVAIDNREPPRLWGLADDTLYVLEHDLWYGLTIRTEPEKDRLFDAVDLYGIVHDNLPVDPRLRPATPIPTRAPVSFVDACSLLTPGEIEAQIGPLSEAPVFQGDTNPVSGSAQTCIYYSNVNGLVITAFRYDTAQAAQIDHQQWRDFGGVERLDAPGDDAVWLPDGATRGVLRVLQGSDLLEVRIDVQEGDPREIALMLGSIAAGRLTSPLPTPTPGPTTIPLDACDLMSASEAETIFGDLQGQPQPGSSVGEGDELGPLYTQDCSYSGADGGGYLSVVQGMGDDHSRLIYDRFRSGYTADDITEIGGLGDAAFIWEPDDYSSTVIVLDGRFVVSLFVTSDDARSMALAVVDIVLGNLP